MSDFETVMRNAAEIQRENAEELERLRAENSLMLSALTMLIDEAERVFDSEYDDGRDYVFLWAAIQKAHEALKTPSSLDNSTPTPDPKGSGT